MKIIRDTREKVGYWDFSNYGHEQQISCLKTGDYTIFGLEDQVCIERKKSTSEIAMNIGKDRKRFEAELLRMKEFTHKYLILEFSVADLLMFPKGANIPPAKLKYVRMNGSYMMKRLSDYEKEFGINVIFADNQQKAIDTVLEIFGEIDVGNTNTNT